MAIASISAPAHLLLQELAEIGQPDEPECLVGTGKLRDVDTALGSIDAAGRQPSCSGGGNLDGRRLLGPPHLENENIRSRNIDNEIIDKFPDCLAFAAKRVDAIGAPSLAMRFPEVRRTGRIVGRVVLTGDVEWDVGTAVARAHGPVGE